jgi:hypothetical protein
MELARAQRTSAMSRDEMDARGDNSPAKSGTVSEPRHFSREPLWLVPLAASVAALLPLLQYSRFRRNVPGVGLAEAMLTAGGLGALASAALVARSHVRSVFWSNVVLWLGILTAAAGACALLSLMPPLLRAVVAVGVWLRDGVSRRRAISVPASAHGDLARTAHRLYPRRTTLTTAPAAATRPPARPGTGSAYDSPCGRRSPRSPRGTIPR